MYSICHQPSVRYITFKKRFGALRRRLATPARSLRPDTSVLAIETSCDDSSVAILSLEDGKERNNIIRSIVNFHQTVTADSRQYNGIHPLVALTSHHVALAELVQKACKHMRSTDNESWKPTMIAATRGPGMRANLGVGLALAKGLAVAWDVPFIGAHHMQAHALTPRLCCTLQQDGRVGHTPSKDWTAAELEPTFPYLSVLVSGGHTMLLQSHNLTEHSILAETQDIALGDCLDKAACAILPSEVCSPPYGRALEQFAFPNGEADYQYIAPRSRTEELRIHKTAWSWTLRVPLQETARMMYSYSGMLSQVERYMQPGLDRNVAATRTSDQIGVEERRDMARQVLRVAFEHLISRILIHLTSTKEPVGTIVMSGGVASNRYLRHVLRQMLDARGFGHIAAVFPPVELCTDNALMIAWSGLEMYAAGYTTSLDVEPIRKWSMDSRTDDRGILGAPGWLHTG